MVFTENQNAFSLKGSAASLGGKPDLITRLGDNGTIYDVKTGKPSPAHSVQVMVYMYAIPRALHQYKGVKFDGKVVYGDHEVDIPNSAVDGKFVENLTQLIRRIGAATPARKVRAEWSVAFATLLKPTAPNAQPKRSGMQYTPKTFKKSIPPSEG